MKTKTDAATVLMGNGWTYEEVERVLGVSSPVVNAGPGRERWIKDRAAISFNDVLLTGKASN
jgi:hypothetical protein